jgi:hypothetical protein
MTVYSARSGPKENTSISSALTPNLQMGETPHNGRSVSNTTKDNFFLFKNLFSYLKKVDALILWLSVHADSKVS